MLSISFCVVLRGGYFVFDFFHAVWCRRSNFVAVGAPQKAGPPPEYVSKLGFVYLYNTLDNGVTWQYNATFDVAADRSINRLFGQSISLHHVTATNRTRLLIGAPGAQATVNGSLIPNAGVAFLYQKLPNTSWTLEVRLCSVTVQLLVVTTASDSADFA
jgi:hypothetical protein